MTPIAFKRVAPHVIQFIYKLSDLKQWILLGNKDGNVGMILVQINYLSGMITHRGYGIIERPMTKRISLHMKHHSIFGELPTVEQVLNPIPFEKKYPNAGIFMPTGHGKYMAYKSRMRWK